MTCSALLFWSGRNEHYNIKSYSVHVRSILDLYLVGLRFNLYCKPNVLNFPSKRKCLFVFKIPFLIVQLINATVSVKRLNDFLNNEEIDPKTIGSQTETEETVIEAKMAAFTWDASHHIPTLGTFISHVDTILSFSCNFLPLSFWSFVTNFCQILSIFDRILPS